jgi:hypothetical protein
VEVFNKESVENSKALDEQCLPMDLLTFGYPKQSDPSKETLVKNPWAPVKIIYFYFVIYSIYKH